MSKIKNLISKLRLEIVILWAMLKIAVIISLAGARVSLKKLLK